MNTTEKQHDAFISYRFTEPDRSSVRALVKAIEEQGYSCWMAERELVHGQDFPSEIARAIRASKVLVLIISEAANESREMPRELKLADDQDIPILPLRIADIPPGDALIYYITRLDIRDAWRLSWKDIANDVARVIDAQSAHADVHSAKSPKQAAPALNAGNRGVGSDSGGRRRKVVLGSLALGVMMAVIAATAYLSPSTDLRPSTEDPPQTAEREPDRAEVESAERATANAAQENQAAAKPDVAASPAAAATPETADPVSKDGPPPDDDASSVAPNEVFTSERLESNPPAAEPEVGDSAGATLPLSPPAESKVTAPEMAPEGRVLRVAAAGTAEFQTIAAAIGAAKEGDRVHIAPGEYAEMLALQKNIHLTGQGATRADVVVTSSAGPCLTSEAPRVEVGNLTLRYAGEADAHCVVVRGGRLILRNTDISGGRLSGIAVDAGSKVTIVGSRVHGNTQAGIRFADGSGGEIVENEISNNGKAGIAVTRNSKPEIRANQISYNALNGVVATSGSGGLYEANMIQRNSGVGILVVNGANPQVRENVMRYNGAAGISVGLEGAGEFVNNKVFENNGVGVMIQKEARPVFTGNFVNNNSTYGIVVREASRPQFKDNIVEGNRHGDWNVDRTSKAIHLD